MIYNILGADKDLQYIKYSIRNSFKSQTTYKTFTVVTIIGAILGIIIEISIWKALYNGKNVILANTSEVHLSEMIQYVIISMFVTLIINNNIVSNIQDRITSGQISIDCIRPVSFHVQVICNEISNLFFNVVFNFLPMLLFCIISFGRNSIAIKDLGLFTISILNSMILYYLINYAIGLISFWFLNIWQLATILDGFVKLFSGAFIPLWFFKGDFLMLANFLPFNLIYYFPISISLNKFDIQYIYQGFIKQIIWIIVLFIICIALWNRGNKKLSVQGG